MNVDAMINLAKPLVPRMRAQEAQLADQRVAAAKAFEQDVISAIPIVEKILQKALEESAKTGGLVDISFMHESDDLRCHLVYQDLFAVKEAVRRVLVETNDKVRPQGFSIHIDTLSTARGETRVRLKPSWVRR